MKIKNIRDDHANNITSVLAMSFLPIFSASAVCVDVGKHVASLGAEGTFNIQFAYICLCDKVRISKELKYT